MEKRIIIRSIVAKPLNSALVILGLVLLAAGGYWWMFSQPSPDDKAKNITRTVEQTAIPTLPERESDTSLTSVTDDSDISHSSEAIDDSDSLPPLLQKKWGQWGLMTNTSVS